MPTATQTQGMFSWNELRTTDPKGARKFYGELLGWQFREMPMPDGEYAVATLEAGGDGLGGITSIPAGAPATPFWGAYLTVDDVDASAAKAAKLGGKLLMPPRDVPTVGRFCVIQDPQGAMVALMTYEKK
jgi:predicted enzyme related to lactoylglutathione lyase